MGEGKKVRLGRWRIWTLQRALKLGCSFRHVPHWGNDLSFHTPCQSLTGCKLPLGRGWDLGGDGALQLRAIPGVE